MLLEYGFRNYFSFREGAEISFRLDSNCPEAISSGKAFTPVMGVKGANAAGKSHVLRALAFLGMFTIHSFSRKPGSHIALDGHFDSKEPSVFYVEFMVGENLYRYELETTDRAVVRETIYRTKAKRVKLIERIGDTIVQMPARHPTLKSLILRSNASIISTLIQHKINVLEDVAEFFRGITSNVGYGGLFPERDIEEIGELIYGSDELRKFVSNFLNKCDTGVSEVRVYETPKDGGGTEYRTSFMHGADGRSHSVPPMNESSGTLRLYKALPNYFVVLNYGGVMVSDEFDMHLHPDILPIIIDLFLDPDKNPAGGQLIFSTHDAGILDKLGRYRTYLVNKEENESFAYRLTSIPGDVLRNDRPIRPAYEAGKIGGVPRL
jgi:uncharacterized protein